MANTNKGSDRMAANMVALQMRARRINFDFEGTSYEAVENIGSGAYGVVCSAIDKTRIPEEKVAVKKIPSIFDQKEVAKRTYREIKILKHFKHDNIIYIREILKPKSADYRDVYIVLDLMESDLHRIIHSRQNLTDEHVRFFLYQILRGLKYIHSANVIHRDLKPSNLLVNENCELKIGDFGMARGVSSVVEEKSNPYMTQYVATRWYRAPELILAIVPYSAQVDVWSVGCIFGEMLGRRQLFPGKNTTHQLKLIVECLGPPTEEFMSQTTSPLLAEYITQYQGIPGIKWNHKYPKAPVKALDLIAKMLVFDPKKRISVDEALKHLYLNKYHDPDDEPVCIPVFDFDFEKQELGIPELKKEITKEIMDYHKPKPLPKPNIFNLKPVPKELLKPATGTFVAPAQTGSQYVLKPAHGTLVPAHGTSVAAPKVSQASVKSTLVPAQGKLVPVGSTTQASGPSELKPVQATAKAECEELPSANLPEPLRTLKKAAKGLEESLKQEQEQKENSEQNAGDSGLFKKPAPAGMPVLDAGAASSDIEMLSAKSSKCEPPSSQLLYIQPKSTSEVDMLSAKQEQEARDAKLLASMDTKARIKQAILAGRFKQPKQDTENKPKPVTAHQRQKEREEKRKKRLSKAKEKKKKMGKDKEEGLQLTDADKNLLERWNNMQQKTKTPVTNKGLSANPPNPGQGNPIGVVSGVASSVAQPHVIQINQVPAVAAPTHTLQPNQLQNQAVVSQTQYPNKESQYHNMAYQGGTQTVANIPFQSYQNPNNVSVLQYSNPSVIQFNQVVGYGNVPHQNITSNASQILPPSEPTNPQKSGTVSSSGYFVQNSSTNSNVQQQLNPPSINNIVHESNLTQPVTTYHASDIQTVSNNDTRSGSLSHQEYENRNPSVDPIHNNQNQWNISTMPSTSRSDNLPSYNEALEALLQQHRDSIPPSINNNTGDILLGQGVLGGLNSGSPKVQQVRRESEDSNTRRTNSPQTPANSPADLSQGEGSQLPLLSQNSALELPQDWQALLTKQMQKSHMDDLTLVHTPKGTGGGYGVGLDLDLIMQEGSGPKDCSEGMPPDSAPLSASLLADWLDVTKDLEMEIGALSPLLSELNMS